jgi:hypothetical protein
VNELACRSEMLGPTLGTGGEIVAPRERRNFNGSALAVMHVQDFSLQILIRLCVR